MKVFALLIVLVHVFGSYAEEECDMLADHPLELLFLIDRSSSKVLKALPRIIHIVDDINNEYRRPKFGISFYSDFQCSNYFKYEICATFRLEDNLPHHTDPEGCYTFNTTLTKDIALIKETVDWGSVEQLPSGNDESGVAAMMMAALDYNLRWTSKGSTSKVIFVVTDAATNFGPVWPQSVPPKGDGTDRCKTMDNPTPELTGDILKKAGISIFLLLADSSAPQDTFRVWKDVVNTMGIRNGNARISDSNERIVEKFDKFMNVC